MSGTDDPSQVYWSQRNARERAVSETPQEPNRYTEYFGVEATGSRIGLMLCRDCGATILLGDEQADAPKIHDEWHKNLKGEP